MLQDSKGGLHLQNSLLLKYLYIYQSHRFRLDNTHTVSKIKSYNSFRLLPHKLKLENIYFKIVSHAEGQKTWVKRSGLYTQFWWLFEQIILVVYTWWLLFFSYMRNHKRLYGENLKKLGLKVFRWDGDPWGYCSCMPFCCLPLQNNKAPLKNINYSYITTTTKSQTYYQEQSQCVEHKIWPFKIFVKFPCVLERGTYFAEWLMNSDNDHLTWVFESN